MWAASGSAASPGSAERRRSCPGTTSTRPRTPTVTPAPTVVAAGPAMDAYLSKLVEAREFRGAVLVARGAHILVSEGYGLADQSAGVPNTPHTLFRVGSVTKQFTALAVLKLQE